MKTKKKKTKQEQEEEEEEEEYVHKNPTNMQNLSILWGFGGVWGLGFRV